VERIVGELPHGRLVRATHLWAGDLFVGFLFAHSFSVVLRRSYRAPREIVWMVGLVALVLGIGLAFTGTILPWSQSAQTQARVGSDLARYVPLVGEGLRRFMRGGEEVTGSTLGHAFGFHVAALPAALTLAIAVHLLVVTLKRAPRQASPDATQIPVYPDFLVRGAALTTAVVITTMTLVVFLDRPLGAAALPTATATATARAHPPWYFLPIHEIVRVAPREMLGMDGARFLVSGAALAALLAALLPFIDRRGSRITSWVAVGVLVILTLLSVRALA
jgi:ubiquinol-cytochrome c reductase cytochrome b subunit